MKQIQTVIIILSLLFSNILFAQSLSSEIELKIEEIIKEMTLEEKVSMCHAQSKFSSPGVQRLGIPELWMADGPHGVRAEVNWDNWNDAAWTNDSCTAFPALTCLASTFNPALSKAYGVALGEEAKYRKKNVLLGPGANIYRTPLNGRNFEYMGEDPYLASQLVVPYIQGVQQNGVAACLKHYVLNNQEKWRNHINVQVSDRALHEIYLPAFKAAVIEGNVWAIMGAYNQYKGQFCCHNDVLVNKILKGDWGFDGVVISDWAGAHDTKEAALYGLDIEMGTWTNGLSATRSFAYENYYLATPFLKQLISGDIEETVVNDKVRRILRLMYRTSMDPSNGYGKMNNKEHIAVAQKIGDEGIVLLKNHKKFFPIDPDKNITIAVIGENATRPMTIGGGSSQLKARNEASPLEGLINRFTNSTILYSMGYSSGPSAFGRVLPTKLDADSLKMAALETAAKADVVLYVGGLNKNYQQDCEGGDRLSLFLPFGQNELIADLVKVNANIGVVLVSGNAVAMPWLEDVNAVMQAWYLGSEAGNSIANVISGDINPSGKLPFTFPIQLSDNSAHSFGEISYPGDSINQQYKEGILVGYRWHDTKNIKPLFSFGYGLSYTEFKITEVVSSKKIYTSDDNISLSCFIGNTGTSNGAEVVQVYVGKTNSKVERAVKELKGFDKVFLKSGETVRVTIDIRVSDLAFYNEDTSRWELEKGDYKIYVGNSSDNITKSLKITII